MRTLGATRLGLCALVATTGLGLSGFTGSPAQAAVASGSIAGGAGGTACDQAAGCLAFTSSCMITPANDIDFSVRAAAVGGQTRTFTWSATMNASPFSQALVFSFDNRCRVLTSVKARPGTPIPFRQGTAYVGVLPMGPFAQATWSLN